MSIEVGTVYEDSLKEIGNAIREKTYETELYKPSEMADKIRGLKFTNGQWAYEYDSNNSYSKLYFFPNPKDQITYIYPYQFAEIKLSNSNFIFIYGNKIKLGKNFLNPNFKSNILNIYIKSSNASFIDSTSSEAFSKDTKLFKIYTNSKNIINEFKNGIYKDSANIELVEGIYE